jgi:hypothetical protein
VITTKRFNEYAADPAAFRADLIVDVNGEPMRFGASPSTTSTAPG